VSREDFPELIRQQAVSLEVQIEEERLRAQRPAEINRFVVQIGRFTIDRYGSVGSVSACVHPLVDVQIAEYVLYLKRRGSNYAVRIAINRQHLQFRVEVSPPGEVRGKLFISRYFQVLGLTQLGGVKPLLKELGWNIRHKEVGWVDKAEIILQWIPTLNNRTNVPTSGLERPTEVTSECTE
jgi:hypothetical protein